ncbi:MAG: DNA mismatch repair endonuclease MutL [Nitrospirae bacterium]|nr:DNA mismatch repair endonuclease MutL [Nitrospirota bacterium]
MPQIKVLPVALRNKIAAGEVIERPASVVKELIENSLDAKSGEIRIEVLRAGKGLIRVSDNGKGMDREDALLCLERHTTSKLADEEGLFTIRSLGFRGEALPSIASVSRMRLITGLRDSPPPLSLREGAPGGAGVSVDVEGGLVKEIKDFPSLGTSVEIRDLFFNTPARKKFLKSNSTELFHVIDVVTREALSRWDVGFSLFTDKQETMTLPGASSLRERILQVYGLEFVRGLLEVNAPAIPPFEKGISCRSERRGLGRDMRMSAFITRGTDFRNSKAHQFIFVNGRPVKDATLSHAVYDAYEGILPHGKHPVFFLFVDIDPESVDVNVHPAKREVRFRDRQEIHTFVRASLREAAREERMKFIAPFAEAPGRAGTAGGYALPPSAEGGRNGVMAERGGLSTAPSAFGDLPEAHVSEPSEFSYQSSRPFIYLGDTFIAMAGKGGLTLIDHHAAHERILYENLLRGMNLDSHRLLFPMQVRLSRKEYAVIIEKREMLFAMGMEIDDFGHDTLIVRSLPGALKEADMRGILSDVATALLEGTGPFRSIQEVLAARVACHSSVRGKKVLQQEEFEQLLAGLEKAENPDQCPHGRPTRIFLSLDDLKKMFRRK